MLPLEHVYEQETGHGVEYTNPYSSHLIFRWLVGFVNDNSILIKLENSVYKDTVGKILEAAKRCLEVWQRLC